MTDRNKTLAYVALGAVCIIWGTTYLALRVGVLRFPPFLFSAIRFILSGPILLLLTKLAGKYTPITTKDMMLQAISGLCMAALGVGVVGYAETNVSSGLAAIICSVMPVWVLLINLVTSSEERPSLPVIAGLIIGLSGILLIFGEHLAEFGNIEYRWGIVLTFLANISWAIGSVWTKRNSRMSNPFMNASLQMFFGGLFLIPLSLLFDDYSGIQWSTTMGYSLLYLILVGSVAAYACYSYAIKSLPMTTVSLYAYINPVVAILLGWLLLDEKLNLRIAVGIAITLIGIYVANRSEQLMFFRRNQVKS